MWQAFVEGVAGLLWPPRCAGCDELIPPGDPFCPVCCLSLYPLEDTCARCALPFEGGGICGGCSAHPAPYARAAAALAYGGPITGAILRFKHGKRRDLARPLGHCLVPAIAPWLKDVDVILPVPLHPKRLRERGFNQALELARAAVARVGGGTPRPPAILCNALVRTKHTEALGHETPMVRRARLDGAFAVRCPKRIAGSVVLIVDDVMTTGATFTACARSLLAAGAREVRVGALARTLP